MSHGLWAWVWRWACCIFFCFRLTRSIAVIQVTYYTVFIGIMAIRSLHECFTGPVKVWPFGNSIQYYLYCELLDQYWMSIASHFFCKGSSVKGMWNAFSLPFFSLSKINPNKHIDVVKNNSFYIKLVSPWVYWTYKECLVEGCLRKSLAHCMLQLL